MKNISLRALVATTLLAAWLAMAPGPAAAAGDENTWFKIGASVQDRSIEAIRLGSGPSHLALVGSIHGGWERNTERLVSQAYAYFAANREQIPQQLTVYF